MAKRVTKERSSESEDEPKKRSRRPVEAARKKEEPQQSPPRAPAAASAPRPVLTAMPRPVRDDELQQVGTQDDEPAVALPPAPAAPEAPSLDAEVREGEPLQVLQLTDLKRMKIT